MSGVGDTIFSWAFFVALGYFLGRMRSMVLAKNYYRQHRDEWCHEARMAANDMWGAVINR